MSFPGGADEFSGTDSGDDADMGGPLPEPWNADYPMTDAAPVDPNAGQTAQAVINDWLSDLPGSDGVGELWNTAPPAPDMQLPGSAFSPYCPDGAAQCWPTNYAGTGNPYGNRLHNGQPQLHDGMDIRSYNGDPVYSVEGGTVLKVYYDPAGGNTILVQNNDGSLSGYAHTGAVDGLQEGDLVSPGQQIGNSNESGDAKGAHLHYTYRPAQPRGPATTATPRVDPLANELIGLVRPPNR